MSASQENDVPRSPLVIAAEAGLVFLTAACLYIPFLSHHFDSNGITEAIALDTGGLFSANHLLYRPLGLLANALVQFLGFDLRIILVLQLLSAFGGAISIALAYLSFREITRNRFAAAAAALWLATTWAYWIFSTDAMYIPIAAMFVAGALAASLRQSRPSAIIAGALMGFAVATWQANVLLVPLFLIGFFFLKRATRQAHIQLAGHFLWACFLPISSFYLFAAYAVGMRTPKEFLWWVTSYGNGVGLSIWGQFAAGRVVVASQTAHNSIVPVWAMPPVWQLVGFSVLLAFGLARVWKTKRSLRIRSFEYRTTVWLAAAYLVFLPFSVWWDPWETKWFVVPNIFLAGLLARLLQCLNPQRYSKFVLAGVLMTCGIANLKSTVWGRRFSANPNIELAGCVAAHMHVNDVFLATDWNWSGYLGYFFNRKEVSVIDWAAALGERRAIIQTLSHQVLDVQQAGASAYMVDMASYPESYIAVLESQMHLHPADIAQFQGSIAFECSGKNIRRVPHIALKSTYTESDRYRLSVSPKEIKVGESYHLVIQGASRTNIHIRYQLDDNPVEEFDAELDAEGRVKFIAGPRTRRGRYRFVGFRIATQTEWFAASDILHVR